MAGSFATKEDDERRETQESSGVEPCCHLIEFLTWLVCGKYLSLWKGFDSDIFWHRICKHISMQLEVRRMLLFGVQDYLSKNSRKVKYPNKVLDVEAPSVS